MINNAIHRIEWQTIINRIISRSVFVHISKSNILFLTMTIRWAYWFSSAHWNAYRPSRVISMYFVASKKNFGFNKPGTCDSYWWWYRWLSSTTTTKKTIRQPTFRCLLFSCPRRDKSVEKEQEKLRVIRWQCSVVVYFFVRIGNWRVRFPGKEYWFVNVNFGRPYKTCLGEYWLKLSFSCIEFTRQWPGLSVFYSIYSDWRT